MNYLLLIYSKFANKKTTSVLWIILFALIAFISIHSTFFKPKVSFEQFIIPHMEQLKFIKRYPLIADDKKEDFLKNHVDEINKIQVSSPLYPLNTKGNIIKFYNVEGNNIVLHLVPSAYTCKFLQHIKNDANFTIKLENSNNLGNTSSCLHNTAIVRMNFS